MRRLPVRLLAAVLVCEGVVLSLLAAAFLLHERVSIIGPNPEPPPLWVHAVQEAGVALWVVVVWAGAHALWFGGLRLDRRDGLAALVFWPLGLACWAAWHFASPGPKKPSSRGRRSHQPKPVH